MPLKLKNEEMIKKSYKVDFDKAYLSYKKIGHYINFNTTNPVLYEVGGNNGLNELASVLDKNLSISADTTREGATPVIYSLLITHGESLDNILSGKVNPNIMKTVCDEIKEVGAADKAANKENLSAEEKATAQEHLKAVQEKLYIDYLNGFASIVDYYKSNVKEEFDKEPENPHSRSYTDNVILAALISHGCTNYMQDPAFAERMKNTYEKVDKTVSGEKITDIDKLFDDIGEEITESLIYKDSIGGLSELGTPEKESVNNVALFNVFLKNRSMANCRFNTFQERMNYYSTIIPPAGDEFFSEIGYDMTWTFHIKNMLKEGTVLSDFRPPGNNADIYDYVPIAKLEKAHKEYVRKQFYNDVVSEFRKTVARDYNDNILTQEELNKGIEDPKVKAKVESPSVAVKSQMLIKRSYEEFLRQLKDTSELNKDGEPAENSSTFMDMYNKVKNVSETEPDSKDFLAKYEESQKAIEEYIKKRDGFIKIHSYGRERLNIAKQMQTMNNSIIDRLKEANENIAESKKETKKFLNHDEKMNVSELLEGGKGKEKENLTKRMEKSITKSKENVLEG